MGKDRKEQMRLYNQSDKGKKTNRIGSWKHRGLVSDNYDKIYDRYINSNNCELCKCEYTNKNVRCLDHCHNTGKFRNIVCHNCNSSSKLCETPITNTSKHKNIYITKNNTYTVQIIVKTIRYNKTFKTIEEALKFRDFLL